ncbi:MAG TPA: alpha/beta hydrolase [Candidatus Nanopelagicales bacterium]
MGAETFEAEVPGGVLVGTVSGEGPPLLLLHGGPALGAEYLEELVPELEDGYRVARYQQRGLAPSTTSGPFDVATQAADVTLVLDALGWDRAYVAGHSWGGHLMLHVLAAHPDRLLGSLVLDPLGGVGDGGAAEFGAELTRRLAPEHRPRFEELDARETAGEVLTEEESLEALELVWPGYYADPEHAPAMPPTRMGVEAHLATWASVNEELPGLPARLAGCTVPTVFVHGAESPMPLTASTDSAAALGAAASVVVLDGTGHFLWHESPGAVRRTLDDLQVTLP